MLGVFDLLNKSWEVYKDKFGTLVSITAIQVVGNFVIGLIGILITIVTSVSLSSLQTGLQSSKLMGWGLWFLVFAVFLLPVIVFNIWASIALIFAISDREENIGIGTSFRRAWSQLVSMIWVDILRGLAIFVGFLLLVIPGIIFSIWFVFSRYVLVAENKKGTGALKASKKLVEGHWWDVLGRVVFLGLVALVVGAILGFVPLVGQLAVSLLLPPFSATFLFMLYEDLKKEKSGEVVSSEL
ncbi:MAG: hypothetical protein V5A57_01020 [Candidatus Paceibacterota bacterium]